MRDFELSTRKAGDINKKRGLYVQVSAYFKDGEMTPYTKVIDIHLGEQNLLRLDPEEIEPMIQSLREAQKMNLPPPKPEE